MTGSLVVQHTGRIFHHFLKPNNKIIISYISYRFFWLSFKCYLIYSTLYTVLRIVVHRMEEERDLVKFLDHLCLPFGGRGLGAYKVCPKIESSNAPRYYGVSILLDDWRNITRLYFEWYSFKYNITLYYNIG